MRRCPRRWLASGQKIGTGAADHVLDDVGQKRGQDDGNGQSKNCDMMLVRGGAGYSIVRKEDTEGDEERVDEIEGWGCANAS